MSLKKKIEKIIKSNLEEKLINYSKIDQSIINEVYDIKTNKKEYILRVANVWDSGKFEREAWAYKKCKEEGLPVPTVYAVDMSGKIIPNSYIILERMPGKLAKEMIIKTGNKAIAVEAGKQLAKMHRIKLEGYGWIRNGKGVYKNWKAYLDDRLYKELKDLYKNNHLSENEYNKIIEFYQKKKPENKKQRLIHCDYHFKNLLSDGKKITAILDFELCCVGDPMMDFGVHFCYNYLKKKKQKLDGKALIKYLIQGYGKVDLKRIFFYAFWYKIIHLNYLLNSKKESKEAIKNLDWHKKAIFKFMKLCEHPEKIH